MIHGRFDVPVTVLVGMGLPRRIQTLMDAICYLDELPEATRDEAYEAAISTCREAAGGKMNLEAARNVFAGYARRRGVMLDEGWIDPAVPLSPNVASEQRRSGVISPDNY